MKAKFNQKRRDVLKSGCTLVGATAIVSIGGSLPVFAQAGETRGTPQPGNTFIYTDGAKKGQTVMAADIVADAKPVIVQAVDASGKPATYEGNTDNSMVLLYKVAAAKIPADLAPDTVDGIMCYSAVCTHLGCLLSNWDTEDGVAYFQCPCHDATFDPLQDGKNMGGATSRTLPHIPIKADGGKLVVADVASGYIGVKRQY